MQETPRPEAPDGEGRPVPAGPLLGKLGHELRSPLTGIIGLTRMLLRGPPAGGDPASQRRQLTLVLTSATQMLRTVEQVVDIVRLQSGLPPLVPAVFDGRATVAEVALAHQPAAAARSLRLLTDVPPEPVLLTTDAGQLRRLLAEIVDNAVKHTDGDAVCLRLTGGAGGTVAIEVSDDGPGIPAGERSLIFEPFERGDGAAGRDEGAGLGLYFARLLAGRLGATLRLRDDDGPGTTFTIELPAAP